MPLSAFQPPEYSALLDEKRAIVENLLAPYSPPDPDVFESNREAYRMRAEFRLWHDGDDLDYVMYRRDDPKTPVPINKFPIACESIQKLMPDLKRSLKGNAILRQKLFQIEFLSTTTQDTLVTLIYHRKLDEEWLQSATILAEKFRVQIIGRSRKQKVIVDREYVTESLNINGVDFRYRQYEQAFTQPNAKVNIRMIEWACECASELDADLLELYCGNGNFTLPLSGYFDTVIATELAKASIKAAKENLAENSINNVHMIRLSAEEVTQAMNGVRQFRRLAQLPKALNDYALNTVFVDPPRAGLDEATEKMVAGFDSIIYISCNPETLAQNLASLCTTHEIKRFALFDQFPYTHHMECGVLLSKR
ncbi:MAG: tRNA (uridine(54)-C5)-methyltransferase TrmA [Halioglobus sp.]